MNSDESLLEFPCRFPIKAMGLAEHDIELIVMQIVETHVSDISDAEISKRPSSNGKYIAITINITAHSRVQLDAIYHALSAHKHIVMAL